MEGRRTGIDNRDVNTDPRSLLDLYETWGDEDAYAREALVRAGDRGLPRTRC